MEVISRSRRPQRVDTSIVSFGFADLRFLILARCVFVTQTAVCTTKNLAPKGEMNYSKVVIRNQMDMDKKEEHRSERKTAEKPRWDNWHVRLPNPKDQQKAIDLFQRSGAETKSDFVRGRILGESFKVITVDKSAVEYYRKLSELTAQIHKIGVLYNQTVRAINSYHSVKTAQILLEKLAKLSAQIIALQEQAISLTIDYRKK